ncbi:MAG: hypothetical protein ACK5NA_11475 [Enterococcus sp.]
MDLLSLFHSVVKPMEIIIGSSSGTTVKIVAIFAIVVIVAFICLSHVAICYIKYVMSGNTAKQVFGSEKGHKKNR